MPLPRYDEIWYEWLEKLKAFEQENGHCRVPSSDPELGRWVMQQRARQMTMSQNRLDALNALGFTWKVKEEAWQSSFTQLKEYKEQRGHCNVPSRQGILGSWVHNQRTYRALGRLSDERIHQLDELGFIWTMRESFNTTIPEHKETTNQAPPKVGAGGCNQEYPTYVPTRPIFEPSVSTTQVTRMGGPSMSTQNTMLQMTEKELHKQDHVSKRLSACTNTGSQKDDSWGGAEMEQDSEKVFWKLIEQIKEQSQQLHTVLARFDKHDIPYDDEEAGPAPKRSKLLSRPKTTTGHSGLAESERSTGDDAENFKELGLLQGDKLDHHNVSHYRPIECNGPRNIATIVNRQSGPYQILEPELAMSSNRAAPAAKRKFKSGDVEIPNYHDLAKKETTAEQLDFCLSLREYTNLRTTAFTPRSKSFVVKTLKPILRCFDICCDGDKSKFISDYEGKLKLCVFSANTCKHNHCAIVHRQPERFQMPKPELAMPSTSAALSAQHKFKAGDVEIPNYHDLTKKETTAEQLDFCLSLREYTNMRTTAFTPRSKTFVVKNLKPILRCFDNCCDGNKSKFISDYEGKLKMCVFGANTCKHTRVFSNS